MVALALSASWAAPRAHRCFVDHGQPTKRALGVPYYWAGVFVLEVARFMYPQQHFGLVDNDCVPVTLFEVPDLLALATSQMQWTDVVGMAPDDPKRNDKVGLLLVTKAHLEYNAASHFDRKPRSAKSHHQSF